MVVDLSGGLTQPHARWLCAGSIPPELRRLNQATIFHLRNNELFGENDGSLTSHTCVGILGSPDRTDKSREHGSSTLCKLLEIRAEVRGRFSVQLDHVCTPIKIFVS